MCSRPRLQTVSTLDWHYLKNDIISSYRRDTKLKMKLNIAAIAEALLHNVTEPIQERPVAKVDKTKTIRNNTNWHEPRTHCRLYTRWNVPISLRR